jgi:hypothetical protein
MEQSTAKGITLAQSITEKINLALMGDSLCGEAGAEVEARWHADVEDTIEDLPLHWSDKLGQMFFDRLRCMCL